MAGRSIIMKGSSASPRRPTSTSYYFSPKVVKRYPPSDRFWEETLRKEPTPKPKSSPRPGQSMTSFWDADLNEMISYSIAQLRKTRSSFGASRPASQSVFATPEKPVSRKGTARVDTGTVDVLLKAAEDVKQKWSQRGGPASALTPNSKKQLVMRMIERSKATDEHIRVETEPMQEIEEERDSPLRVMHTEGGQLQAEDLSTPKTPQNKRLQEELRGYKDRYKRMEAMYSSLLVRREGQGEGRYRRMYEELKEESGMAEVGEM